MATRRHSTARATEGRFIASRIQDARRRGATNREIADAFGVNERTVRKIVAGETSGVRTFGRLEGVKRPSRAAAQSGGTSIVRVNVIVGKDANGNDIYSSVNAQVPVLTTVGGGKRTPTQADIFRVPGLYDLIEAERSRLAARYANTVATEKGSRIVGIMPIAHRKAPLRIRISAHG